MVWRCRHYQRIARRHQRVDVRLSSQIIEGIRLADSPAAFFDDHLGLLIWIAFLLLIAEPVIVVIHLIVLNGIWFRVLMMRWQTHRYLLRQSVSFFANTSPAA